MKLELALDRLHARAVGTWWLHPFTAITRALLVVGFVEPGLTKVLGHRFTTLPLSSPVGFFFEAFYRTSDAAPIIRVSITAKLLAALSRDLVGSMQSDHQSQAAVNDMVNITAAFSQAAGAAVSEIVNWALRAPPPRTG